jgi:hypothetical protein
MIAQEIHGRYLYAGYIILPLEIAGLPDAITVHGEVLRHQPEFHISLVGVKHLAPVIAKGTGENTEDVAGKLIEAFTDFTANHEVGLANFIDDFRYVTRDDRAAVFVRCEVKNLKELFAYMRQKTGYIFALPPTHVTLYARPGKGIRGIGVISDAQLAETEPVTDPSLDAVRSALDL